MNASWIIPFIILGGALQTCGAAINGQLNKSLANPFLASAVSFLTITFFHGFLLLHASPAAGDAELARDAVAGAVWRADVGRSGLRRAKFCNQSRGGYVYGSCRLRGVNLRRLSSTITAGSRMDVRAVTLTRLSGTLLLVGGVVWITRK